MSDYIFSDRPDAGRQLAQRLLHLLSPALLSSAPEKAMWLKIAEEWERMAGEASEDQKGGQFAQQPGVDPVSKEPEDAG
jgi:hypothetical protein